MSIKADILRGHTDTILLALLLRGDSYGYELNKQVQYLTGGQYDFKEATLYTAFKRLEGAGLITSYWGEAGAGARRRYYAISEMGRAQWRQASEEWRQTKALLDALIFAQGGNDDE